MEQFSLFQPKNVLKVSQLTTYLRQLLEDDPILQDVWVEGEISNFARPSSGHLYFTLKDGDAAVRCVMWRNAAQRMTFAPREGLAVQAHGSMGVYEASGQVQLYVDTLTPAGEGALFQEFLRLKAKLEAEGLFEEELKRELPWLPKVIGIVTSADRRGAAGYAQHPPPPLPGRGSSPFAHLRPGHRRPGRDRGRPGTPQPGGKSRCDPDRARRRLN